MHLKTIFIFFLLFSYASLCMGNDWIPDSIVFKTEAEATFSGGSNTPFWLVSNKFGLGTPVFNNGYVAAQVAKPLSGDKKLSWGATIDLAAGWNQPGAFRFQQLFAELKYRSLWISLGSREYFPLYNNFHLSSGDLLFSGNALPIPQLRVGTYDFAPFWGCNGWFSVKAYLSYGIFTDAKWQKDWASPYGKRTSGVLFCGRGVWFKLGNESKFPLTADFGVEMGTQFGGSLYQNGKILKMPTKFINWLKAFIPLPGGKNTPEDEQTNVEGNVAGEYSLSINYSIASRWNLRVYGEHYFEDHSQMFLEYGFWKDGLWGLEVTFPKNPFIASFVYEYIATKDQTGSVLNNWTPGIPEQVSGQDSYFDHYLYGPWQTWGLSMGTPLAISPLYNKDHHLVMYNTRFIANHFGLEGAPLDCLNWRVLLTFTQNWGTYYYPLSKEMNNFSGLVQLEFTPPKLKGFYVKGALAWDHGALLGNNFGGSLSVGFTGDVSLQRKKTIYDKK